MGCLKCIYYMNSATNCYYNGNIIETILTLVDDMLLLHWVTKDLLIPHGLSEPGTMMYHCLASILTTSICSVPPHCPAITGILNPLYDIARYPACSSSSSDWLCAPPIGPSDSSEFIPTTGSSHILDPGGCSHLSNSRFILFAPAKAISTSNLVKVSSYITHSWSSGYSLGPFGIRSLVQIRCAAPSVLANWLLLVGPGVG